MNPKMKSIYTHYYEITEVADNWLYYTSLMYNFNLDTVFQENNSKHFIKAYFSAGGKNKAFDWMKNNKVFKILNDRANHAMSAFLLGIVLRDSLHMRMREGIPMLHKEHKKNFLYFWSLICLYHDVAFNLERKSDKFIKHCLTIQEFSQEFEIQYNLLDEIKDSEIRSTIKKYYSYIIAEKNLIDHGIAGAMLFYDGMMKAYYDAKKEANITKQEPFAISGLKFNKNFPNHICYIAKIIAQHNIWRANDHSKNKYVEHQLNNLIPNENNDHMLVCGDKHNLLFLLGLIDSIEPLKCFNREQSHDPYSILKNLLCNINYRKEMITFSCTMAEFDTYKQSVKKLEDWLDVSVDFNEGIVSILINQESKKEKERVA